ncbi:hypothetical protein C1645_842773 [Glomus cerebriforme]|uniref:Uncharacterized protein n=1 Tax=Glomus cerebriforme TaxID=658196 RepID=A0A397S8M0_9GLOM|nr:hypothetical protein C1645_842773 [Glomus cerebriforme]
MGEKEVALDIPDEIENYEKSIDDSQYMNDEKIKNHKKSIDQIFYCLKDKPKDTAPWEYSQINDIEITKSLYGQDTKFFCSIYRTKLFLIVKDRKTLILQFDLLTRNLERQYTSDITPYWCLPINTPIIMNKNQTLLAILVDYYTYIFSKENGTLISKHNCEYYFYNFTVYF